MLIEVYFILFLNLLSPQINDNSADSNDPPNNRANCNKNVLVAQISNLSDPSKSRSVKHLSFKPSPSDQCQSKEYCALDLLPTAAESLFPWRRDKSYQSLGFGTYLTQKFCFIIASRFVRLVFTQFKYLDRKLFR